MDESKMNSRDLNSDPNNLRTIILLLCHKPAYDSSKFQSKVKLSYYLTLSKIRSFSCCLSVLLGLTYLVFELKYAICKPCHPRANDKKVLRLSVWVLIRKFQLLIGKISLPVSLTKRFFSFGNGGQVRLGLIGVN